MWYTSGWIIYGGPVLLLLLVAYILTRGRKNPYPARFDGKTIIVVGGTAGIGKETVKYLVRKGAKVIFTGRQDQKAREIQAELKKEGNTLEADYFACDLSDLDAVKKFAKEYTQTYGKLDILINNAGLIMPTLTKTKQGLETTMGTNYVAPLYLTSLLFPLLEKAPEARVINVSSEAYKVFDKFMTPKSKEDFLNANATAEEYSSFGTYGKSKLGNIYFTQTLAKLLDTNKKHNIKVVSLHPGAVMTDISRTFSSFMRTLYKILLPLLAVFFLTEEGGAQTTLTLAAMPFADLPSGAFFSDCRAQPLVRLGTDEGLRLSAWNQACAALLRCDGERVFAGLL